MSATTHQPINASTQSGSSSPNPFETHQEACEVEGLVMEAREIRFPWYEPEVVKEPRDAGQQGLFGGVAEPTRFHSGATSYWDCRGFMMAGVPVGITATALSKTKGGVVLGLVEEYTSKGGLVFVDSGAFGAFVSGKALDFEVDVFPVYDELVRRVKNRNGLHLVMPDVVGDPEASMRLQTEHADRIRSWIDAGVNAIFPLHSPRDEVFMEGIGRVAAGRSVSIGVPSNLEAWTSSELVAFCDRVKPAFIHLLGMGSGAKVRAIAQMVAVVSPDTLISCDSCTLLAHVGYGRRLTDRCSTRLQDAVQWVMDDPTAQVPYPDLSTYVANLLYEANYLQEADVRRLAARFGLDVNALLEAGERAGLIEVLGTIDPDETWFHQELGAFAREELLKPKLEAVLRGPIRAWEVARLAGMVDEEVEAAGG